jgi:hypothetical protein
MCFINTNKRAKELVCARAIPAGIQQCRVMRYTSSCFSLSLSLSLSLPFDAILTFHSKCVSGHFNSACTGICSCGTHGTCSQGKAGNGACSCFSNWDSATNCTSCLDGTYGNDCQTICQGGKGANQCFRNGQVIIECGGLLLYLSFVNHAKFSAKTA